jgi:hypothetical protein
MFRREISYTLNLDNVYCIRPTCEVGLFPLDDDLALLPGQLTLCLHESVIPHC